MADKRESFPSLEIDGTEVGAALAARQHGDAALAKNGAIGFAFRDASDNVVMPKLNSAGQLPVTSEASGNGKTANGKLVGTQTQADVAVLTLTPDKRYENLDLIVSCFRDSIFELVQVDDATETSHGEFLVGPGCVSLHAKLQEFEILAGSTGTQELIIRGENANATSDMRAIFTIKELV